LVRSSGESHWRGHHHVICVDAYPPRLRVCLFWLAARWRVDPCCWRVNIRSLSTDSLSYDMRQRIPSSPPSLLRGSRARISLLTASTAFVDRRRCFSPLIGIIQSRETRKRDDRQLSAVLYPLYCIVLYSAWWNCIATVLRALRQPSFRCTLYSVWWSRITNGILTAQLD
jgi:hypothetical protein